MRPTALLLTALMAIAPSATARRRAVMPPAAPILTAVVGTEATATNYGSTPSPVQRCVDDQQCSTEVINPGETKRYAYSGQVLYVGPRDAGKVAIESDGLTLPPVFFRTGVKIIPGAYDTTAFTQAIGIVSSYAGAISMTSISPAGTIQQVKSIPITRGLTLINATEYFDNIIDSFQFQTSDPVALFSQWTNKATGKRTRIPALRVEDAYNEAYLARVTPSTILMVKNALMVQQGGVNLWFLPSAGIDVLQFGRGIFIQPYGLISATDLPSFTGSSGEGSLKITGAPEGQNLLPFFAWAITEGVAYPLTRFQQAATAHGTGPNSAPYQNLLWTGLRTDATHHTELVVQSMDSLPNTGTLTLDDQGNVFSLTTVSLAGYSSQRINLDPIAGTHTLYNATLQMHDNPSTQYPNDTPRATGIAIVTSNNGANARAPIVSTRAAPIYEMTTTIGVWDNGKLLQGSGTTNDIRLMQIITGISNPENRAGGLWTNTNGSNWQTLHDMIIRIRQGFTDQDYVSVFGDSKSTLAQYLTDQDGDGTPVDVGSSDWPYDNDSAAPGNQVSGTMFINYTVATRAPYVMTADIQVWDGQQQLTTSGTSTDERLMQIVAGTTTLASRVGTFGYSNTNTNYQGLQDMLGRILAGFQSADYQTVFGETYANLSPYLNDTDSDSWMIDCGPTDFPGDNTTTAPGNQPKGVMGITYRITQTGAAEYDATATIQVRDNGQTFEQTTHPSIGTILTLTNVNNPDALLGNHGYVCLDLPDPVVNSVAELLANYAKLTPAEQQEFSGDREGFVPFAANGCDASKTQYVLLIAIAVAKRASAQTVHQLLPAATAKTLAPTSAQQGRQGAQ